MDQRLSPPNIEEEITLNSPISPWVLIMDFAPEVVNRGVLLSVRKDGFTVLDRFGIPEGIDLADERLGPIKIPLNEPSFFGVVANRRTTYRGKVGRGKWTDYFLDRLGGKRPHEVLVIPVIVGGRVVALFYGDDDGTGKPFGEVDRLEALIRQTFTMVESSLAERGKKSKPRR